MSKSKFSIIFIIACVYLHPINLGAQNIQSKIDSIQVEIEKIREAKFKCLAQSKVTWVMQNPDVFVLAGILVSNRPGLISATVVNYK